MLKALRFLLTSDWLGWVAGAILVILFLLLLVGPLIVVPRLDEFMVVGLYEGLYEGRDGNGLARIEGAQCARLRRMAKTRVALCQMTPMQRTVRVTPTVLHDPSRRTDQGDSRC